MPRPRDLRADPEAAQQNMITVHRAKGVIRLEQIYLGAPDEGFMYAGTSAVARPGKPRGKILYGRGLRSLAHDLLGSPIAENSLPCASSMVSSRNDKSLLSAL
jgi:hypothetical protein